MTGTDTGVGKTLLCAALLAGFPRARYAKPVQTGWPEEDDAATVEALARAAPGRVSREGARLREPCSPHHAAALEDLVLHANDLARTVGRTDDARPWVIEGAGGLLSPLSGSETMLDLARALGLPVLIAAAVRLGAINATLLTLGALTAAGLPTLGVVPLGPPDPSYRSGVRAHTQVPLLTGIPRLGAVTPAAVADVGRALAGDPALAGALA